MLINVGPDSSHFCSMNTSEGILWERFSLPWITSLPAFSQSLYVQLCTIMHPCIYTLKECSIEVIIIFTRVCSKFLRVLNFAFLCKSIEISNFITAKNSHLKVSTSMCRESGALLYTRTRVMHFQSAFHFSDFGTAIPNPWSYMYMYLYINTTSDAHVCTCRWYNDIHININIKPTLPECIFVERVSVCVVFPPVEAVDLSCRGRKTGLSDLPVY